MLIVFELDEELLGELEKDISIFVNKIIDLSQASLALSSHLNAEIANRFGVTQKELSIQVAEDHIRELALKADIEVICLFKDQVQKANNLINELRVKRIILLK
jgi:hypothetical protein